MLEYYLKLALRNLRNNIGLTLLMVLAVGFGVAASMTSYSVFRAVSGDPIPWKSSRLFFPLVDMWGSKRWHGTDTEPPDAFDYLDATALMRAHRAKLQSALYLITPSLVPADNAVHPQKLSGYAAYGEFFSMVDTPFQYGGPWSTTEDEQGVPVTVVSKQLNEKLFAGANSVGRTVELDGKPYRITGVMDDWDPQPRYYDLQSTTGFATERVDVFIPFTTATRFDVTSGASVNCNGTRPSQSGIAGLEQSNCVWISFMAELDDEASVTAYRQFLENYARDQQQAGRFNWAPNVRLRNLPDWLTYEGVVPSDTQVSLLVAFGLLLVCVVNTAGLLLAKNLRRSAEIGVRRALGATKRDIYVQYLVETGVIGLAGGVLGLLLTWAGVVSVHYVLPVDIAPLAHMDIPLLVLTLFLAVVATVLAGLYPALRASRVQPSWQLKAN